MGTWLVGAVVLAAAVLAAREVYKDRQKEKACGQGCGACGRRPGGGNERGGRAV